MRLFVTISVNSAEINKSSLQFRETDKEVLAAGDGDDIAWRLFPPDDDDDDDDEDDDEEVIKIFDESE